MVNTSLYSALERFWKNISARLDHRFQNAERNTLEQLYGYSGDELYVYPEGITADDIWSGYYNTLANNTTVKCVVLPTSMNGIPNPEDVGMFEECTNLEVVKVLGHLEYIEGNAFKGCTNLKTIEYLNKKPDGSPDTADTIYANAFYKCGLLDIDVSNTTTFYGSIFGDSLKTVAVKVSDLATWQNKTFTVASSNPLFYGRYLYENGQRVFNLDLCGKWTSDTIGQYAFVGGQFTNIKIPKCVTTIGKRAFDKNFLSYTVDLTDYGTNTLFPSIEADTFVGAGKGNAPAKILVATGRKQQLMNMTNWSKWATDSVVEEVEVNADYATMAGEAYDIHDYGTQAPVSYASDWGCLAADASHTGKVLMEYVDDNSPDCNFISLTDVSELTVGHATTANEANTSEISRAVMDAVTDSPINITLSAEASEVGPGFSDIVVAKPEDAHISRIPAKDVSVGHADLSDYSCGLKSNDTESATEYSFVDEASKWFASPIHDRVLTIAYSEEDPDGKAISTLPFNELKVSHATAADTAAKVENEDTINITSGKKVVITTDSDGGSVNRIKVDEYGDVQVYSAGETCLKGDMMLKLETNAPEGIYIVMPNPDDNNVMQQELLTIEDIRGFKAEVGKNIPKSDKGIANGIATLDANARIPTSQLPSYVDDVIEVSNFSSLPTNGEGGKIYVTLDTNKTYRWSGSNYTEISASLALGETSSTAYAGDKGKATTNIVNQYLGEDKLIYHTDESLLKIGNSDTRGIDIYSDYETIKLYRDGGEEELVLNHAGDSGWYSINSIVLKSTGAYHATSDPGVSIKLNGAEQTFEFANENSSESVSFTIAELKKLKAFLATIAD